MTFIFNLTKFRASTLMNICPHKEKLQEGQKNGQNGIIKHCWEYMWFNGKNPIKKLAWNLDNEVNDMNVITIETVKHYGQTALFFRFFWWKVISRIFYTLIADFRALCTLHWKCHLPKWNEPELPPCWDQTKPI